MKRPGFYEGVGVALVAAIGGGILFTALTTMFAGGFVLRVLVAGMGLLYLLYLLRRSEERVGRLTTLVVWVVAAAGIWLLGLSLPLYVIAHLGLLWLGRSLYFYSSLFSAFADLGLLGLGLAGAVWALFGTGNPFLSFWCFFLIQALFVFIPSHWKRSNKSLATSTEVEDRFQHAHRVAEASLTRLSAVR